MISQPHDMGGLKFSHDGAPLRGDGSPFPANSAEWSPAEGEYLKEHYFGQAQEVQEEPPQVTHVDDTTVVEVNEIHEEGEA